MEKNERVLGRGEGERMWEFGIGYEGVLLRCKQKERKKKKVNDKNNK